MYAVYKLLTYSCALPLSVLLNRRLKKGKESPRSLKEKKGIITRPRSGGSLLWVHGASVGESQSALILINHILKNKPDTHILVTTGTLTSAKLMDKNLPQGAFHQFYPLDHPQWVRQFLDHWQPDAILWMESELWPNMLHQIKKRNIPAALINARMSPKSFKAWQRFSSLAKATLSTFSKILCQTDTDKNCLKKLGAQHVITTDNLKHSAQPLHYDEGDLENLNQACKNKTMWLYASTHDGEEQIAHEIHKKLEESYPDLLTIIVPRHPDRRDEIKSKCAAYNLKTTYRGSEKKLPKPDDDVYIADTLGELGLFYKLSPISCIGRSLSNDGGGGHNPIESAQLGSGVLYGENIQNLQKIYDEMHQAKAAIRVDTPETLYSELKSLLSDDLKLNALQKNGQAFSGQKSGVVDVVMKEIEPILRVLHNDGVKQSLEKSKKNASANA